MRAKMIVRNGQHVGQSFVVDDGQSKIIGRDASCDFQMYDKGLSRNHSLIESKEGRFVLSDLGSTNGTFVNGKMVITKPLEDGDLINVGKIQLQFFLERPENPLSTSVRLVEDNMGTIGPQSIMRRVDIDSVIAPLSSVAAVPPGEVAQDDSVIVYQLAVKTLHQLSVEINAASSSDELFEKLMGLVMQTLQAERGFVLLHNPETGRHEAKVARSRRGDPVQFQVSRTIVDKVVAEELSILSSDAMADDRFKGGMSIILNQIKSVMCVPLKSQNRILGAIYVDSSGSAEVFKEHDLELLSIIGMQAGIAAERMELNEQVVEQAKMKQALEVARNIQRSFLPEGMPDQLGLDIVGWSESCDETGGDYYDFLTYPDGRLGFAVGDVSGHGVGAALLMATARAFLRALVTSTEQVGELFDRLNHLLEGDLDDDQFMTFFYGLLDPQTWELYYTSAGHESPILYHAQRNEFEELPSLGVPLGMLPNYEYPQGGPIQFEEGDVFVLATDGIVETMNPSSEEFGRQRFEEVVKGAVKQSANQIVRTIHEAVTEFAMGRPARDDLTLVVVKFEVKQPSELRAMEHTEATRAVWSDQVEQTRSD